MAIYVKFERYEEYVLSQAAWACAWSLFWGKMCWFRRRRCKICFGVPLGRGVPLARDWLYQKPHINKLARSAKLTPSRSDGQAKLVLFDCDWAPLWNGDSASCQCKAVSNLAMQVSLTVAKKSTLRFVHSALPMRATRSLALYWEPSTRARPPSFPRFSFMSNAAFNTTLHRSRHVQSEQPDQSKRDFHTAQQQHQLWIGYWPRRATYLLVQQCSDWRLINLC